MAELISCEDCGHKISQRAAACPNCGCPPPNDTSASTQGNIAAASGQTPSADEPATDDQDKPGNENSAANVGCLVIIALAVFFWAFSAGSGSSSSKNWRDKDNSIGAYVMMQTFVERRLKSPSTADFPSYSDSKVTRLSGQQYRVRSYVDSQNGFGATIRTSYTGTIEKTSPDKWRLQSLDFQD